ncbi:MAG: HEAT repeat domain-containing protein, partial [Promethearchaeota archaeon]
MEQDKFSVEIQPIFEKLVGIDDPIIQIQAVYDLTKSEDKEGALTALLYGLVVADVDVKLAILDVLSQPDFLVPRIIKPLQNLLDEEDFDIRQQVVEILGMTKDSEALEPLEQALNDNDGEIRHVAMSSLANIGDNRALEDLYRFQQAEDWEDRSA